MSVALRHVKIVHRQSMLKKLAPLIAGFAISILSACGGGASESSNAAPANSALPQTDIMLSSLPGVRVATKFELNAPHAKSVYLAGDMTNGESNKQAMQLDTDGIWRITMDLPTGQWIYKFIVDNVWTTDPVNPLSASDGRGGRDSFMLVGEGDWIIPAGAPRGEVRTIFAPLKTNIYLPPGYQAGQHYPLLVLLHGMGMDADQWFKTGVIDRFMDSMIANKKIEPFIVVMPSSDGGYYTGTDETQIMTQVLPRIKKDYGVSLLPADTAIAGISMGGFGSFNLAYRHSDIFGLSEPMSGYYSGPYLDSLGNKVVIPFQLKMVCGSTDFLLNGNRSLANKLTLSGVNFTYKESIGAHEWHYWTGLMPQLLADTSNFFHLK